MKKKILLTMAIVLTLAAASGCGKKSESAEANIVESAEAENTNIQDNVSELAIRFGDDGEPYTMHLYDNDTAKTISALVSAGGIRLPIYHFDDYENWEVMQYYDIPESYDIPHNPETITSEKAGEVYFAEPNRIVLFYKDADISGEFTRLGYFDYSDDFVSAVENNPVLEGWGNKIVVISK